MPGIVGHEREDVGIMKLIQDIWLLTTYMIYAFFNGIMDWVAKHQKLTAIVVSVITTVAVIRWLY